MLEKWNCINRSVDSVLRQYVLSFFIDFFSLLLNGFPNVTLLSGLWHNDAILIRFFTPSSETDLIDSVDGMNIMFQKFQTIKCLLFKKINYYSTHKSQHKLCNWKNEEMLNSYFCHNFWNGFLENFRQVLDFRTVLIRFHCL